MNKTTVHAVSEAPAWCRKYPHGTAPNEADRELILRCHGLMTSDPVIVYEPESKESRNAAGICQLRWPECDLVPMSHLEHPEAFVDSDVVFVGCGPTVRQWMILQQYCYSITVLRDESGDRPPHVFARDILFPLQSGEKAP